MRTPSPLPERAAPSRSRRPRALAVVAAAGLAAALVLPASPATAAAAAPGAAPSVDLGREVIAPGDGWASWSGDTYPERAQRLAAPTTGGSSASPADVYVAGTWQELRDALAGRAGGSQNDARYNTVPRIVYVTGTLDPWLRADGTREWSRESLVGDRVLPPLLELGGVAWDAARPVLNVAASLHFGGPEAASVRIDVEHVFRGDFESD